MAIPMVTFNNGNKFPILGLGTWQATKEECQNSIRAALDAGYRHIDTAYAYGNEADIGEVLQEYMKAGKLKRSDFYITTKDTGTGLYPLKPDGTPAYLNLPPEKTWEGMEKAVKQGKAKNIGVSNFTCNQIERICKIATIKPVTNQVECHAYFNQTDMQRFCQQRGILLTSYGSLGSPGRPDMLKVNVDCILLDNPVIKKLADKYKKSVGQVLLRNLTQRNILVIPKSIKPARIKQNMQIFDFKLTDAEMKEIEGLQKNVRLFKNDL
ncbi:hypothetical protein SNE40_000765 [Patella caerulea]|uniref:NADP-dependent oxidoreductase domain-containing protein n=1 Tax=Patella caerulea TaxID=87958 RepID=A0AAN8KEI6_PATCE